MPNLAFVVGARPNFMKVAPILRALDDTPDVESFLIHTGQHYDPNLSDVFFRDLGIRPPDVSLDVRSGSHGVQTARVIERVERLLAKPRLLPQIDRLVVVGDVNSTMASAVAASKLGINVAHVEAGLRSFDRSMPEEINRVITDSISDLLLVSEPSGVTNLRNEGHAADNVHLVGNVMIDTLVEQLTAARSIGFPQQCKLRPRQYAVLTMHRPGNVDQPDVLEQLVEAMIDVSNEIPVAFPVHPRTQRKLTEFGLDRSLQRAPGILLMEPLGYLEFLSLTSESKFIVTDSGGLQEEATYLGIPCLTLRPNTERPITVDLGSSTLIGNDAAILRSEIASILDNSYKQANCPELWDGRAAQRMAPLLAEVSVADPEFQRAMGRD